MKTKTFESGLAREILKLFALVLVLGLVILLLVTLLPIIPYTDSTITHYRWDFKGGSLAYVVSLESGSKSVGFDWVERQWRWDKEPKQKLARLHLAIVEQQKIVANSLLAAPTNTPFWSLLPVKDRRGVLYTRTDRDGLWLATTSQDSKVWSDTGIVTNLEPSPDQKDVAFTVWNKDTGSIHVLDLEVMDEQTILPAGDGPRRSAAMPIWYQLGWSEKTTLLYTTVGIENDSAELTIWKVSLSDGIPHRTALSLQAFHRYYNDRSFAFDPDKEIVPLVHSASQSFTADRLRQAYDAGDGQLAIRKND